MRKITLFFAMLCTTVLSFGQLSGDYYIPQGTNPKGYASLALALADVTTNGLSGTVTFYIDGDLSEIGANVVVNRTDLNATNNLVIKPAAGKTPTITFTGCVATAGATQYSGMTLNNTGFVTIDGSNMADGTSKDLTLNMNDATNGRNIVHLYGNCDNVTIKNTKVIYQSPMNASASTRGIYLNGQASGASDNLIVENCTIGDASLTPYYAVSVTGSSGSAIYCNNIDIKNNELYGVIRPLYFFYVGTSTSVSNIDGNTIYSNGLGGYVNYYVLVNTWGGTINFTKNRIPAITIRNADASGFAGLSGLTAQSGAVLNVNNNYFGGTINLTGSGNPAYISHLYVQDNGQYNIYNNTFYFPATTNPGERSNVHLAGSTSIVNLKNNIIINHTDLTNSYAVWKGTSTGAFVSDYNDLYVSGASANIGYSAATPRKTLVDWQTASSQDANSTSVDVQFENVAAGDLRIAGTSQQDINLSAPLIVAVSTDILGAVRQDPTYKGAHQGTLPFITTGVDKQQDVAAYHVRSTATGVEVTFEGEAAIELYTINGVLINRTNAFNSYSYDLNKGAYIIRVKGKATKFVR